MKSTLRMSLVLVALLLTFSLLLTGCGHDEIDAKIDDNAAKAQTAVNDAAKKAHDDLASAVAKLETLVNSGNTASAAALTEAVAELNAAIDAAKAASTGADASLKAALEAAIAAAKTEAITASQTALDAAKADLEAADKANADDVVAKVKVLNDAIVAATDAAGNAIANLKEELTIAIASAKKDALDAVADAKTELTKKVDDAVKALQDADKAITGGSTVSVADLVAAKDEAVTAIANLQTLINGVDQAAKDAKAAADKALVDAKAYADSLAAAATKGIEDTLAAAKAYTEEFVATTLTNYDDETVNVLANLDKLADLKDELASTKDWYLAATYDELVAKADVAWVKIMRAVRVGDSAKAYGEFENAYKTADSIIDSTYKMLIALKADIADIQELIDAGNNAEATVALKALQDENSYADMETAYTNAEALPGAPAEMADYTSKDEAVKNYNIVDEWGKTQLAYSRIIGTVGGALVKDAMVAINATLITPTNAQLVTDMATARTNFDKWAETLEVNLTWDAVEGEWIYADKVDNFVADFEEVIDAFIVNEDRMAELTLAKAEAEAAATGFIDRIEAIRDAIALKGATNTNKTTLDNIKADLFTATTGWVARYKLEAEKALYDADNETAEAPNYKMFGPANLAAAEEEFEDAFEAQNVAFADFRDAVEAIKDKAVTLMMYDEINKALDLYDLFKVKTGADTFDMIFTDGEGNPIDPADYYTIVVNMKAQYNALRATATTAYTAAFTAEYKALTVNNINIYTDLTAVRAWFDTYVKNQMFQVNAIVEGYNFDNNDETSGYALNDSIVVTKADYDAFVKLEATLKALTDAKKVETEDLIDDVTALAADLAAVADLTTEDQETIEDLAARREAWEKGTKATEIAVPGYDDVALIADQYKITDPAAETTYEFTNRDVLLAAETRLDTLLGLLKTAQDLIDALVAKTVSTDFADVAARNTYKGELDAIDTAMLAFDNANLNVANYDNRFSDADLAKIENGKLAVNKFDDLDTFFNGALKDAYDATVADATYAKAALDTVKADITALVNAVTIETDRAAAEADIDALILVAAAQAKGVSDSYADYEASKVEVDGLSIEDAKKTEAKGALEVAYDRALNKIANGYNEADGDNIVHVEITTAAQVENIVTTLKAEFDEIVADYQPAP